MGKEGEREGEIPESNFFPSVSSLRITTSKPSCGPSICIPSEKFPEFQISHNRRNYLQLAQSHLC